MTREAEATPNELRTRLLEALPEYVRAAVQRIVKEAAPEGVYAVGGAVRDLLLGRQIVDVDLTIEADPIPLMRRAFPGLRVTTHTRFRTASIVADGTRIDVAVARRERYEEPGALPTVEPADIEADLMRRDFSVNAIALRISGEAAVIDPARGVDDVGARTVRVLHDDSFADDATRIFRAFRYAARLGFLIEHHTANLVNASVGYINTIGGERLRRELELMIEEENAAGALRMSDEAGALAAIHSALAWRVSEGALTSGAARHAPRVPLGFALLASRATRDEGLEIVSRLRLKREERAAVAGIASMRDLARTLRRPEAKPSGVATMLDRYPPAAVAAFVETTDDAIARELALRYLEEWRGEKPILTGRDLQELGIPEGPQVQRGLQLIRAARLDGWATDRGDEVALAMRFAKSIRDSSAMNAPLTLDLNGN